MVGATEAIHSQSTSQTGHLCHVQESFPYLPAESQILHLYLGSFKAASFLWAALGRMEKHAQPLFPLILGEQGSSSKCEVVVLHFPAFLITEGFGKGEVGTSQHELTYPCPDRLLITGAVSNIKTSKSVSINAKQNQEQWHSSHKSNKVFCFSSLRLPRSCCLNLPGNPGSLVTAASPGLSPGHFPSRASTLINTDCSHQISLTLAGDASPVGK